MYFFPIPFYSPSLILLLPLPPSPASSSSSSSEEAHQPLIAALLRPSSQLQNIGWYDIFQFNAICPGKVWSGYWRLFFQPKYFLLSFFKNQLIEIINKSKLCFSYPQWQCLTGKMLGMSWVHQTLRAYTISVFFLLQWSQANFISAL